VLFYHKFHLRKVNMRSNRALESGKIINVIANYQLLLAYCSAAKMASSSRIRACTVLVAVEAASLANPK
jgi:hypothetical protein